MTNFHGSPLCETNDGNILWEFPSGKTGIISNEDAKYLVGLMLNKIKPTRRKIRVIRA